ncbi:MAG: HAD family hydrolase [Ruminococcus sp.]
MYKIVIFDLDGTLANTLIDLADATNVGLAKAGLPAHPVEKYKKMVGGGVLNLVKRAMSPVEDEKLFDIVKNGFDEYYKEHSIDKTCAYEGTEELLNELSKKGIATAVLSNKPDEFVAKILKKIYPDHSFAYAWGKKPEYNTKPDPEALNAILSLTGFEKEECIYVGDSNVDCFTAQNAGVKCCGVSWGFRGREELENAGADHVIDEPLQLIEKFGL